MTSDTRFWIEIASGAALALVGIAGSVYTVRTQARETREAARCDAVVKAALDLQRPTSGGVPPRTAGQLALDERIRSSAARCLGNE